MRTDSGTDISTDARHAGATAGDADRYDLSGRTVLVTGATSGIGLATATALADRGARLLLGCRPGPNPARLAGELDARPGPGTAEHLPLDLADLASVRAGAAAVVERGERVDVLVNNAGVAGRRGTTAQGFELTFGVNHLGHFLLTTRLLDGLGDRGPRRVVTLASKAHFGARGIDFAGLRGPTRTRTGLVEYQVSKLCNVLFAAELARRYPDVEAYAVHPGLVASDIWRQLPRPLRAVATRFMAPPGDGAAAPVHAATAPARVLGPPGGYLDGCEPHAPGRAVTPGLAAALWRHSEAWAS